MFKNMLRKTIINLTYMDIDIANPEGMKRSYTKNDGISDCFAL